MLKITKFFSNNKKFILDQSGKSPAFFLRHKNVKINNIFFKNLIKFSKLNKNINCRICLHQSKNEKLHSMIVLINSKNHFNIHRHLETPEMYQLIKGTIKINIFNNKKNKVKTIIMKKKNEIFSVNKNQYHIVIPKTRYAIFHETKFRINEKTK